MNSSRPEERRGGRVRIGGAGLRLLPRERMHGRPGRVDAGAFYAVQLVALQSRFWGGEAQARGHGDVGKATLSSKVSNAFSKDPESTCTVRNLHAAGINASALVRNETDQSAERGDGFGGGGESVVGLDLPARGKRVRGGPDRLVNGGCAVS